MPHLDDLGIYLLKSTIVKNQTLLKAVITKMPRFYVPFKSAESGTPIPLPEDSVHHAMRVLRLRQGDEVEVFNGRGCSAKGIIQFAKNYAEVIPEYVSTDKPGLRLILLQSLVANEKMDWIIEKACELGYEKIIVFPASRSETRLTRDRLEKRLERWKKITVSACKQCGSNILPEIRYTTSIQDASLQGDGLKLVLAPAANNSSLPSVCDTITFAVGPEGGLSLEEIKILEEAGFLGKRLGNRILRTETAAIAAASYARTLWGDFS